MDQDKNSVPNRIVTTSVLSVILITVTALVGYNNAHNSMKYFREVSRISDLVITILSAREEAIKYQLGSDRFSADQLAARLDEIENKSSLIKEEISDPEIHDIINDITTRFVEFKTLFEQYDSLMKLKEIERIRIQGISQRIDDLTDSLYYAEEMEIRALQNVTGEDLEKELDDAADAIIVEKLFLTARMSEKNFTQYRDPEYIRMNKAAIEELREQIAFMVRTADSKMAQDFAKALTDPVDQYESTFDELVTVHSDLFAAGEALEIISFEAVMNANASRINTLKRKNEAITRTKSVIIIAGGGAVLFAILIMGYTSRSLIKEINTRQEAEEQLLQTEKTARKAAEEANEAKSNFLANVSHELRTPLNAIMGMTHLMKQTKLNSEQKEHLGKIDGASQGLLKIINDILDFARIREDDVEIQEIGFSLGEILDKEIQILSEKSEGKGLELRAKVNGEIHDKLIGDPLRLTQVLNQVVGNAIKFTNEGRIEVTISPGDTDLETQKIQFSVTDTGIGIAAEEQESLFQAFSQGDASATRSYGGTGLGLVITRNLVTLMGGSISFDSEPGKGSTFIIVLPFRIDKTMTAMGPNLLEIRQSQSTEERPDSPGHAITLDESSKEGYLSELTIIEEMIKSNDPDANVRFQALDGLKEHELFREVSEAMENYDYDKAATVIVKLIDQIK